MFVKLLMLQNCLDSSLLHPEVGPLHDIFYERGNFSYCWRLAEESNEFALLFLR